MKVLDEEIKEGRKKGRKRGVKKERWKVERKEGRKGLKGRNETNEDLRNISKCVERYNCSFQYQNTFSFPSPADYS